MKIYQIKYTNYGIVKYCYSSNFVDIYLNFTAIEKDMIMVTENTREFERISNIVIENWIERFE